MPNPYFEPDPFNYNDYGLTVFQPDMVLTHKQLNTVFGFLLGQEQRTRTRLIGVGVVCGLEVSLESPTSVRITRGCGVTTEGDLLCLENDLLCTQYLPHVLADHAPYAPFSAIAGLELWELFPAEYTPTDTPQPLTAALLADKVAMLYLDSAVQDADDCTGVACDNKGDVFLNRLRVLLVRRSDAARLIRAELRQAAAACAKLPRPVMRRVRLDDRPYDISLRDFRTFIRHVTDDFAQKLFQSFTLVDRALNPDLPDGTPAPSPVQGWVNTMRARMQQHSTGANIQYVYGWLKDLYDAYEEFREAACQWLVGCMPDETWFPKHLLLGELVPDAGNCRPQFRHYFRKSPAVAPDPYARERVGWLHRRIGVLIENFDIPPLSITISPLNLDYFVDTRTLNVKITPDRHRMTFTPLSLRAMPFYYTPETRQFWSFEKWKNCQTNQILSYHPPAAPIPTHVEQPFAYGIEPYAFYRIEGFIGAPVDLALRTVLGQRQLHNLAFDVVALRADSGQTLITLDQSFEFEDLLVDFAHILFQIRCGREDIFKLLPSLTLQMPVSVFTTRIAIWAGRLQEFECIPPQLILLARLNSEYNRRKTAFETSLTFSGFRSEHPGMEHGAGVPRGGTFVLVYKDRTESTASGGSMVIADFYLPYLCCSKGNAMKFVLPDPPPTISMPKIRFCVGDPEVRIDVSPPGGNFPAGTPNIIRRGAEFFFNPATVAQQTLVYTAPDGRTASLATEVLALPTAAFNFDPAGDTVYLVNNSTGGVVRVEWDFGDGSPVESITLSAGENGNTQHRYTVDPTGSTFEVRLTVFNAANCAHSITHRVTLQSSPNISIKASNVYCFHQENRVQISAEPSGGTFSSPTLKITPVLGQFVPNVPGYHDITYTLPDGGSATARIFILPDKFEVQNAEYDLRTKTGHFEALILTPPAEITYKWALTTGNIVPVRIDAEPGMAGFSRHFFTFEGQRSSDVLTLTFEEQGNAVCDRILHQFSFVIRD